jgi:hypothetical protein
VPRLLVAKREGLYEKHGVSDLLSCSGPLDFFMTFDGFPLFLINESKFSTLLI